MDNRNKLVPASKARNDYFGGISAMCEWRWRKAGILPEPININGRNFFRESDLIAAQERQAHKSEAEQ